MPLQHAACAKFAVEKSRQRRARTQSDNLICYARRLSSSEEEQDGARGNKRKVHLQRTFGCCRPAERAKNKYDNGELERGLRMFGTAYICEEECHKKLTGRSPSNHYQISGASLGGGTSKNRAKRMRNTLFSLLQNVTRSYKRKGV